MGIRKEIAAIRADQQTVKEFNEDLAQHPYGEDGEPRNIADEMPQMTSRTGRWIHGQS